jgi:thioredoxin-dependent peroxiredoxin
MGASREPHASKHEKRYQCRTKLLDVSECAHNTSKGRRMNGTLRVGAKAPGFKLRRDGGGSVALDDYVGRKLVLYFYPKDDTSGCTAEALDFNKLKPSFAAANTEILGVSPDPVKSHDKFRDKHKLGFALASDEEKAMLQAYGVWAEKSMYGRKYMGVERTTVLIDGAGRIARIWPKVKVPGHAEDVLAAATAI